MKHYGCFWVTKASWCTKHVTVEILVSDVKSSVKALVSSILGDRSLDQTYYDLYNIQICVLLDVIHIYIHILYTYAKAW